MAGINGVFSMDAILERKNDPTPTAEELSSGRRRRSRTVFSKKAVQTMEAEFERNRYPDISCREAIAAEIGVSEARVQVWFQNRRARSNKGNRVQDMGGDVNAANENPAKRRRPNDNGINGVQQTPATELSSSAPHCSAASTHQFHWLQSWYYQKLAYLPVATSVPFPWFPVYTSAADHTGGKPVTCQDGDSDDFVKRLFRFSAVKRARSPSRHEERDQQRQDFTQQYRMIVPPLRATDCSVSELHESEERASDHPVDSRPILEDLEADDSGLATDSFCETV